MAGNILPACGGPRVYTQAKAIGYYVSLLQNYCITDYVLMSIICRWNFCFKIFTINIICKILFLLINFYALNNYSCESISSALFKASFMLRWKFSLPIRVYRPDFLNAFKGCSLACEIISVLPFFSKVLRIVSKA